MLAGNLNQPRWTACGREDSGDLHRERIDFIHLSVGVRRGRRYCEIEPLLCPIPNRLLNSTGRGRVSEASVIDNLAQHMGRVLGGDEGDERGGRILVVSDQDYVI